MKLARAQMLEFHGRHFRFVVIEAGCPMMMPHDLSSCTLNHCTAGMQDMGYVARMQGLAKNRIPQHEPQTSRIYFDGPSKRDP